MKRKILWYGAVLLACGVSYLFLGGQSDSCLDTDGDGYFVSTCGSTCHPLDCNDSDGEINPGSLEGPYGDPACCDGLDNDCDGFADMEDPGCRQTASALPETGIGLCYDDVDEILCPGPCDRFYGQDAQYLTNPMSFTDNGDGTVTDNVTGLLWQRDCDDVNRDWWEAIDYCESLSLAGATDWRIPDEHELQSIVDYGRFRPAVDTTYFPDTPSSGHFWASSADVFHTDYAWRICFTDGSVVSFYKTWSDYQYVKCVRGEAMEHSFTDNGDGTVSDNRTGLMWQQVDEHVYLDWEGALAYCEGIELAGHTDWRLPDIKELSSIFDSTRWGPALDTTYFLDSGSTRYWSSSTLVYDHHINWVWLF